MSTTVTVGLARRSIDRTAFQAPSIIDNAAAPSDADLKAAVTSLQQQRRLEAASASGQLVASDGATSLFIRPGYRFRSVDGLLTNFHLPRSTLLMLVSAFGGRERVLGLYQQAVRAGYRFYSYGDALLLL